MTAATMVMKSAMVTLPKCPKTAMRIHSDEGGDVPASMMMSTMRTTMMTTMMMMTMMMTTHPGEGGEERAGHLLRTVNAEEAMKAIEEEPMTGDADEDVKTQQAPWIRPQP